MAKSKYRKKRLIVFKNIQSLFALFTIISIILITIFLFYEFMNSYFISLGFTLPENGFFEFVSNPLFIRVGILLLWTMLCYGISVFVTTNKIIGPLIPIYHILDALIKGDYTVKANLRINDYYYKDIEKQLNELISVLSTNKAIMDSKLHETEKKVFELADNLKLKNLPNETIDLLKEVKDAIEKCKVV